MTTTTEKPAPVEQEQSTEKEDLVHILQFDSRGRPPERALCGKKVTRIMTSGGAASCKECVRIRLAMKNDRGWVKL